MADAASVLSGDAVGASGAANNGAAGGANGGAPTAGGAAAPEDWTASYAPDVRTAVQAKGYKSHADVAQGWLAASKLVGVDPNNVLKLPGKDADEKASAAAMDAIYARLGRPDKADGYALPEALAGDPVAAEFREKAHAAGLSSKQAEALLEWYTGVGAKAQEEAAAKNSETQGKLFAALKAEVGAEKFPEYVEDARRASRVLLPESHKSGLTGETLTRDQIVARIEDAIGADLTVRMLNQAAQFTREDKTTAGAGAGMKLDGAGAQARKEALMRDKAWVGRWMGGDVEARKEMSNLDTIIHAGRQAA